MARAKPCWRHLKGRSLLMNQEDKDEGVLQGSQLPYQCWKVEVSGLFRGVYLLTKVCANKDLAKTNREQLLRIWER